MPRRNSEPVRITSASAGHSVDLRHRQRRYLVSMGVRTVCFVLAVLFRHVQPLMWTFIAASFVLPYVAVVMANAGSSAESGGPDLFETPERPGLERGPRQD